MTWVRIDDHMAEHPKLLALGDLAPMALALQLRALCWSSRQLTDGRVPTGAMSQLLDGFAAWGIETGGSPGLYAVGIDGHELEWPVIMVKAGLWDRVKGGYQIHDYLKYNPSRDQVLANREAAKERMQRVRSGRRSPDVRQNFNGTSREVRESSPEVQKSSREVRDTPTPTNTKSLNLSSGSSDAQRARRPARRRRAPRSPEDLATEPLDQAQLAAREAKRQAWKAATP